MRIAIVVAFFDPSIDYVETTIASWLAKNNEVHVVTSTMRAQPLSVAGVAKAREFEDGTKLEGGVWIHRLRPNFNLGQRVVSLGVLSRLEDIAPELLIQSVPAQLFSLPAAVYSHQHSVPMIYISGENAQQGPQEGVGKWLKKFYMATAWRAIVRYSARRARCVVGTTPETLRLLSRVSPIKPTLAPLPVKTDRFYFDSELREKVRAELGFSDKAVVIFTGRFVPEKKLEALVSAWENFAQTCHSSTLVLVGAGDDAYSKSVQDACRSSLYAHRISVLPFQSAAIVNQLLNASDVGVWPNVSISIQQAMVTGLQVILPSDSPGRYLVERGSDFGLLFDAGETDRAFMELPDALQAAFARERSRSRARSASEAKVEFAESTFINRICALGDEGKQ